MKGFSLIELIVTLAIVAIVVTAGVPDFTSMLKASRVATASNEFTSTVKSARSEAVKRGMPVTLCASTDGQTCSDDPDWSTGWVVIDDDGALIYRRAGLSGRFKFKANTFAVRFMDSGFQEAGLVQFFLSPQRCETGSHQARSIEIDRIGHVDVVEAMCTNA